jgi:hypothetical protein
MLTLSIFHISILVAACILLYICILFDKIIEPQNVRFYLSIRQRDRVI